MLVFIDESGYPIPSDPSEKSVLLAICIAESDLRTVIQRIFTIKDTIYGNQDEIKSTQVIRPRTITHNMTKDKSYAEKMVALLSSVDCSVFSIIMDRPTYVPYTEDGKLPVQYHRLLQRIQAYCTIRQSSMALCIFDQTDDGKDKKYSSGFNNFLYRSIEGRQFDKILVSPLFVSSSVTSPIELADICAGIVRIEHRLSLNTREPLTEYEQWLHSLFLQIERRTRNLVYHGKQLFGFYLLPPSCFRTKDEAIDTSDLPCC